jgi:hypothetical protein
MPPNNHHSPPEAAIKALEDAKKILETSAQTNRNLFIAFNSVLVTVLILCLSVTDEMLLLGSSTIKLPLLNIDLPIWAFATIAPLALLTLHFDLLQNLSAHREKLIVWCKAWFKVYPSPSHNADMPQQLYPFLFDFAWLYVNHTESATIGARLLPRLCWLLYCWGAYTVLVIFFVRFSELQHYGYSSWHCLLLVFDALIVHWYWPGFTQVAKFAAWKLVLAILIAPFIELLSLIPYLGRKVLDDLKLLKLSRAKLLLLWLSNMAALWTLVLFILIQLHIDCDKLPRFISQTLNCSTSPRFVKWALEREIESRRFLLGLGLVPRLTLVGFRLTLPDKFFVLDKLQHGQDENQLWQEKINYPLDLSWRRLAFADFSKAQLPHIDLNNAKLQGAYLGDAKLQGVYLEYAQLQGANLEYAQLQGANLASAQLQGAHLLGVQLQGAYLESAQLQGASLGGVQLQGAYLRDVQLQGAYLWSAQLQGANLASAKLQGASLKFAKLQGAVLIGTSLKGVELSNPDKQFEFSWTQQLDWQQAYDFSQLKTESWAESEWIQQQLVQAQQDFKPPQLLPPIDKEKFATIWLTLLCKDDYVTKAMLEQLNYVDNHPITKVQAQQYLNSQEACKPYRTLLKINDEK